MSYINGKYYHKEGHLLPLRNRQKQENKKVYVVGYSIKRGNNEKCSGGGLRNRPI
jgi:hypothetical protein